MKIKNIFYPLQKNKKNLFIERRNEKGGKMMDSKQEIIQKLHQAFIVSCQALSHEPLHGSNHMQKMALAAIEGGAQALRMNSALDIIEARKITDLPIIGIVKRDYEGSNIFISPTKKEIDEIASSGAEIIAIDMTSRKRPTEDSLTDLVEYAHGKGLLVMADLSEPLDAEEAAKAGADFLGTTLAGYTEETKNKRFPPDFDMMAYLIQNFDIPVIAEGGISTEEEAVRALAMGCHSVVVGSAITRPQLIAKKYGDYISLWKKKQKDHILAIDLGGTNIRFARISCDGKIHKSSSLKTKDFQSSTEIINGIINHIKKIKDIAAISIATAGQIDIHTGQVVQATKSIHDWKNQNLKERIEKELHLPCYIDNDANLALLGEYHYGAAKNKKNAVMLTLGTGLGGGMILDGKLYHGSQFLAANWGQSLVYSLEEKQYITMEEIISGTGLARLAKVMDSPYETGEEIMEALIQNDPKAIEIIEIFCDYLARLIHQIEYGINPEIILIGGGLSDRFDIWKEFLSRAMKKYKIQSAVDAAQLKNAAGLLGAAAFYFKTIN